MSAMKIVCKPGKWRDKNIWRVSLMRFVIFPVMLTNRGENELGKEIFALTLKDPQFMSENT